MYICRSNYIKYLGYIGAKLDYYIVSIKNVDLYLTPIRFAKKQGQKHEKTIMNAKNKKSMRLVSWNVNGIRACLSKGMQESVTKLNPNILCLQEIKADSSIMEELVVNYFPEYILFNSSAVKKGYSGVATLIRKDDVYSGFEHFSTLNYDVGQASISEELLSNIKFFSEEGRFSVSKTNLFNLFNLYIPSGTSGETRQSLKYVFLDQFYDYLLDLIKGEVPLILCGDFNICHRPIDIHHPKQAEQRQLTGFLPQERAWMDKLIGLGFVDCFRAKQGDVKNAYSWWSYRAQARPKNLGWRIDYVFCSKPIADKCVDAQIHTDVEGSDHCPVSVDLVFD